MKQDEMFGKDERQYVGIHFTSSARGQYLRTTPSGDPEVGPYPDINCRIICWDGIGVKVEAVKHGFRSEDGDVYAAQKVTRFIPWTSIFEITLGVDTEYPTDEELDQELDANATIEAISRSEFYWQAVGRALRFLKRREGR